MKEVQRAMRFTVTLLVSALLAVVIGYCIDQWLHTTPLCILLCLAYAIFGSLYQFVKAFGKEHD